MIKTTSWDSQAWLDDFNNSTSRDTARQLLADVYQNTIDIVTARHYVTEQGSEVKLPNDRRMIVDSVMYSRPISANHIPARGENTVIEIVNADSIDTGHRLLNEGFIVAVLNLASDRIPGGGVVSGSSAQEESLFRRSNLFRSLYQFSRFAPQYGLTRNREQYPLNDHFGAVYTPGATIFRTSQREGFRLLEIPYALSFIAVAAVRNPELDRHGWMSAHDVELTLNKMRTILRVGLRHGHDALVLGAMGCGSFHNPPKHVAQLFHEVINEPEFRNKFRHLTFAILARGRSMENLAAFQTEFQSLSLF